MRNSCKEGGLNMRAIALGFAFCGMLLAQNTAVVSGNWSTYGIFLTPYNGTPAFAELASLDASVGKSGLDQQYLPVLFHLDEQFRSYHLRLFGSLAQWLKTFHKTTADSA